LAPPPFCFNGKIVRECRVVSVTIVAAIGVGTLRKFVRIALIVCLAIAAISIALTAAVGLWAWYKTSQVESFYREHPLLSEMRAHQQSGTSNSAPARQAFLEIVPLGTDREATVAVLGKEGFDCKTVTEPAAVARLRSGFLEARGLTLPVKDIRNEKALVECLGFAPAIVLYTTWIVALQSKSMVA
jgi:hypothetical protein